MFITGRNLEKLLEIKWSHNHYHSFGDVVKYLAFCFLLAVHWVAAVCPIGALGR